MEQHQSTGGTLTLTGEGQVQAKPDLVVVNLGVVATVKSAQEATAKNAELMTQVLNRMKALGIPSEDLQTIGFSIAPVVDYDTNSPNHGQTVGYRAEEMLMVKAPVALAGKILDEAVTGGANLAGNLSFGLRDEAAYRQRALHSAVKAIHGDAETMAKAMGVLLRGAQSVEVLYGGSPVILRTALSGASSGTQVEPGRLTISCGVRMVLKYEQSSERWKY
jgi:uncharacterized protein YggE